MNDKITELTQWGRGAAKYFLKLTTEIYRQFMAKNCQKSAAALTYVSLFSLVPMLTVVYAMLSIIPSLQGMESQIQDFIFENLVPSSGQALQEYLHDFTSKARGLTLPGVAMLIVTAYFTLKTIEKNFNAIWGVTRGRSGVANFLLYWAVLSLGPLLMGGGLAMSTYLLSKKLLVDEYDPIGVFPVVLQYLPWLLSTGVFTLFYAAVPNCRVPIKDAFIGGALTALCFEVAKDIFGVLVAKTSYQLIYGAFAIVPLFLLWTYVLWVLVLSGAVLVRSLSHLRAEVKSRGYPDSVAAVFALNTMYEAQNDGDVTKEKDIIALGVYPEQWFRLRRALIDGHVITETQSGGFVIIRDLRTYVLEDLLKVVDDYRILPKSIKTHHQADWTEDLFERIKHCDETVAERLRVPLATLFAADKKPAAKTLELNSVKKEAEHAK